MASVVPQLERFVHQGNATMFELVKSLSLPTEYLPQAFWSVVLTWCVVALLLVLCFPSAVRAAWLILTWSPWLLATLVVTCYNFFLVLYTLVRILIALVLYLILKFISGSQTKSRLGITASVISQLFFGFFLFFSFVSFFFYVVSRFCCFDLLCWFTADVCGF